MKKDKQYLADSMADISHQLRTPLTAVNLQLALLREPGISEEKRTSLMQEIRTQLNRIDWLINTLLKISRLDSGCIRVCGTENSLFAEIIIEDTGTGITEQDLPHIFERFYKGENSSNNSVGIGLALSRMIITTQNGTVKVENKKEGGCLFTIRFYKAVV